MRKRFEYIATTIVKNIFLVFAIIFTFGNIFFSTHIDNLQPKILEYNEASFLSLLLTVVLFVLILFLIKKDFFKINDKKFLIVFLLLTFFIGIYWIFSNDVVLREFDDAYNTFNAALAISRGDYGPLSYKSYVSVYPNNVGMLTYDLINIKLFGEYGALYSIRIINLLFVVLGYFYLYKINVILFNENRTRNCILITLMFLSLQYVFYCFFVYGNCISYTTALMSSYYFLLFLKTRKHSYVCFSILLIIVSIVIKMNSLIIAIAMMIYLFIDFINNKKIVSIISIGLLLFGSVLVPNSLQKLWGNKVGINYNETKLPTICWIAYGFNYNSNNPGCYTNEFENYHCANDYNSEYTALVAKEFINESFNYLRENPAKAIMFISTKFLSSWTNPQFEAFDQYRELKIFEINKSIISGKINNCINQVWDCGLSIVATGILMFIIKKFNNLKLYELFGAVIVIGGLLFHSFWEVKAIYLYQYYMYLLPYAAYGITLIKKK